ncbi:beta-lactamase-like protein [Schizophyllum commune]
MATSSGLNIPHSDATVIVKALNSIDSEKSHIPAALFMSPVLPGREDYWFPDFSFLIENPALGRRVMFDLGARDPATYPPPIAQQLELPFIQFVVNEIPDQLVKGNIDLKSIDTIIWSHAHMDHIGDTTRFPPSTDLVVGRGMQLKLYPDHPESGLLEKDISGRNVRELTYGGLKIGDFDALDYFEDGSLYLLDAPGHAPGHTCALARVTPTSFVLLGADISHHPGHFRPSASLHRTIACPSQILAAARKAISAEHFGAQDPSQPFDLAKRTTPMFDIADGGAYEDPPTARKTLQKLLAFDAHPDILVVIAHDLTLVGHLPLFPKTINDWKKDGLKEKVTWASFEPGNRAFRYSSGGYLTAKRRESL